MNRKRTAVLAVAVALASTLTFSGCSSSTPSNCATPTPKHKISYETTGFGVHISPHFSAPHTAPHPAPHAVPHSQPHTKPYTGPKTQPHTAPHEEPQHSRTNGGHTGIWPFYLWSHGSNSCR